MITVLFGNDVIAIRQSAFEKATELAGNEGEVEVIDSESYQAGVLSDIAGAVSLFGTMTVYVLDTPSSQADYSEETTNMLESLSLSTNHFVVIEGALLAADKKRWSKYASEIKEYKAVAGARFNTFALAEALAKKDKKSLWMLLQESRLASQSAEEVVGVLWWQLKALRSASLTNSATEAGMKDYPYDKAKRSLKVFAEGDLDRLSKGLLSVYHDGHLGKRDIDLALEEWCLRL
jgi:DNA polymerase III delta subunit